MQAKQRPVASMLELKASAVTKGNMGAQDEAFGPDTAPVPTSRFFGQALGFASSGGGSGGGGGGS